MLRRLLLCVAFGVAASADVAFDTVFDSLSYSLRAKRDGDLDGAWDRLSSTIDGAPLRWCMAYAEVCSIACVTKWLTYNVYFWLR